MRFHSSFRALPSLLLFSCLLEAAPLPPEAGGILDRAAVVRAAATIDRQRFPNADDVLVDDHIRVRYHADGRSDEWDDTYVKVLTEKGKRQYSSLGRHFTIPYGTASFTLVEVIKPDGTVVPVEVAKQSRVMVDDSQMGSNIYNPNNKVLRVGVPDLEIGDIVHYVARRQVVKPRVPDTWSDIQVFQYTSPMLRYTYEVVAPRERPLQSIALKDAIPGTVSFREEPQEDRIRYVWEVRDIPRMYREPGMPDLYTVVQRLLVSTIPDWQTISRWYWTLSEPHFAATAEMRAKTAALIEGIDDRDGKIRAIFKFVSQEIRYMGITVEKEAPGYEPHDAAMTFEARHGVCRDKAALLVAMLRIAGFEAFPVLIHNGPKKDVEVPQPFFNHAVSAVRNPDGSYTLMDATDENTANLFPAYLGNQSYLVATPEGDPLRTSPIVPSAANMMNIRTTAELDDDEVLAGTVVLEFNGINDNVYRGFLSRSKPERRRRLFESAVKRLVAGARLTELTITPTDLMDTATPLQVTLGFRSENALAGDDYRMLAIPRLGHSVGMVNFILGNTGLEERNYPMLTDCACGVNETLSLSLPESVGTVEALPVYPDINPGPLRWRSALSVKDATVRGATTFTIDVVEFSPAEYLQLKDALKQIELNDQKCIIFRGAAEPENGAAEAAAGEGDAPSPADVVILDSQQTYRFETAHSWTAVHRVRKQVLTYKGKKDNAELKLSYNPAWAELTLDYARVITNGTTQTISEQEQNLMDARWVAGAPRYPPAKVFVASLPGVEVGSVIEHQYTIRYRDLPFFGEFISFQQFRPVRRKQVVVDAPADLPLTCGAFPGGLLGFQSDATIPETRTEADGRRTITWTMTDQPALKQEPDLPPLWSFCPTVAVTTGSWPDYARALNQRLTAAATDQPGARALARELTAGKPPIEAVRAIRDTVARRIRTAGPWLFAMPLDTVTPADRTLADGYGNAADQAVLLYTLLREAGFSPGFFYATPMHRHAELQAAKQPWPIRQSYLKLLVRVVVDDRHIYLNDTNQYDYLGATGRDGLPALDLETGAFITIRPPDACRDRDRTDFEVTIDADGTARIQQTQHFFGTDFGYQKQRFEEMPPEERRRFHQELVASVAQAARPDGDLVTDFAGYPGTLRFAVTIPNYAVVDGPFLYFDSPASLAGILGLRGDSRTNDLYLSRRIDTAITSRIGWPQGFVACTTPFEYSWRPGAAHLRITVTPRADGIPGIVTRHVASLCPMLVPAGDYDTLFDISADLRSAEARTILLKQQ